MSKPLCSGEKTMVVEETKTNVHTTEEETLGLGPILGLRMKK